FETFEENFYRPRGAPLKQGGHFIPLGGAGMRGYSPLIATTHAAAINGELSQRLIDGSGAWGRGALWVDAFADVGCALQRTLTDAGVGVGVKGRLYDRDLMVRLDLPIFVSAPGFAAGKTGGNGSAAVRWIFALNDLW